MAIAFCAACGQNVYLTKSETDICPVCAASLHETEDTIRLRLAPN